MIYLFLVIICLMHYIFHLPDNFMQLEEKKKAEEKED